MRYDLADYATMVNDPVRGPAYLRAVRETVRPGDIVADIGAGPGVLGVYAAMLGARRVFLIEPDASVAAARALAEENGVSDRVEIIMAPSREVTLPELADVIVSDMRGVLPLFGTHLLSIADARERLLAFAGRFVPRRDTLHVALVEDSAMHDRTVGAWRALDDTMKVASLSALLANDWMRMHARPEQLLTASAQWSEIHYPEVGGPNRDGRFSLEVARAGTAHGLLCWFDAELSESSRFSNAPHAPRALYGQAFFPFAQPLALRAGDVATGSLRAVHTGSEYEWAWAARIVRDGQEVAAASQSTLAAKPQLSQQLARRAPAFVPRLSADGDVTRFLMENTDGLRDVAELSRLLRDAFPSRFTSVDDAQRFVVQHDGYFR